MKDIKIAHLQLLPILSGVQNVTLREIKLYDPDKVRPVLICQNEGPLTDAARQSGADVYCVPTLVREISPLKDIQSLIKISRLIKSVRPDVVHTHSSKTGIIGRIAARIAGVPVVVHTVHGFAFPFARSKIVKFTFYLLEYIGKFFCDAVIVLNDTDKEIAIKLLKFPEHKVHLIPNGVDLKVYGNFEKEHRSLTREKELSVNDDETVCIGMVGRLWEQKNPFCLALAAREVIKSAEGRAHFFFIGDGELRDDLEEFVRSEGIQEYVTILGWRDDVPALLGALDIFVLPSRWEGMPLAILEAMASRVPVIVSDIPGNNDLVAHGVDGLIFESENSLQLADRILQLIMDPGFRRQLGENARAKVVNHYQLSTRQQKVLDVYCDLLERKS